MRMKLAILFFLPVFLLAQPPQPVVQDPAKARLEGQVLNSVTNEPLRKTRLTLRMNVAAMTTQRQQQPAVTSTYTVTSDAVGKFEFPNVDPGDYQLTIRRDGFANLVLGSKNAARKTEPILLGAGDRKADFLVRLVPLGTLSGSVLDEDGDPIRNITVSTMTYHYTSNGRELEAGRGANTNDLGEYRIFDVPAGKYFLKVGQRNIRLNSNPDDGEAYGSVFYPGYPQVSGAIAQEVTPGAQLRNLNFNLRKTRYPTLRGRVVAPPGATSVNAGMMIVTDNGQSSSSGDVKGKDFQFEFYGVNPGPLYLIGSYLLNGQRYTTSLFLEVGGNDIDGIELRPIPQMDLGGQVRIVGETTIKPSQLQVTLESRGQGSSTAAMQEDGTFVFRAVTPAAYRVNVSRSPNSLYIKSIHWGTTETTDTPLDLTNGVPPRTELSIVLGADAGQLDGVVTNEKSEPCDAVTVTLIPTGGHRSRPFYKFPVTDAAGKFTISGIAPGSYKLLAWDKVDNNAVMYDPEFLRPYESNAQTVEVLPGNKKTLDLKLTLNKEP
jgi:Carboxypeptidase regulatory-like domain